ncbi:Fungal specific transcription factor domain-containing protein, partial [Colletotrichum scovillei]
TSQWERKNPAREETPRHPQCRPSRQNLESYQHFSNSTIHVGTKPTTPVKNRVSGMADIACAVSLTCATCGRTFSRRDSLLRHTATHKKTRSRGSLRRKSCLECARAKIRCDNAQPVCSSCLRRQMDCQYDHINQGPDHTSQPVLPPVVPGGQQAHSVARTPSDFKQTQNLSPNHSCRLLNNETHLSVLSDIMPISSQKDCLKSADGNSQTLNFRCPEASLSIDSRLPDEHYVERGQLSDFLSVDMPLFEELVNDPVNFYVQGSNDLGSGLSNFDIFNAIYNISPAADDVSISANVPMLNISSYGHDTATINCFTESLVTQPFPGEMISESVCSNLQSWLFRRATDGADFGIGMLESHEFPDTDTLNAYLNAYFAHFGQVIPIVHRPTFNPNECPLLTLAMACVGAGFSGLQNSMNVSIRLSRMCRDVLFTLMRKSSECLHTLPYLIAQLLQGIHGFSCGEYDLYDSSQSLRSLLSNSYKRMLASGTIKSKLALNPSQNSSLGERWFFWVQEEQKRRIGRYIYEYDYFAFQMHSSRPILHTSDVTFDPDGPSCYWEATTAGEWHAVSSGGTAPQVYPVPAPPGRVHSTGIDDYTDQANPGPATFALQVLLRSLCSIVDLTDNDFAGILCNELHLTSGTEDILDQLRPFNRLLAPSDNISPIISKETIRLEVQAAQMVHMAHLHSAGKMMRLFQDVFQLGSDFQTAIQEVLTWGSKNVSKVRDVAFHAAQVLGIVRHYPFHTPSEAFNVFKSGLALFCASRWLSEQQILMDTPDRGSWSTSSLRLDYIPINLVAKRQWESNIQAWVQERNLVHNPAILGTPNILGPAGQKHILGMTMDLLRQNTPWGISMRLSEVLARILGTVFLEHE